MMFAGPGRGHALDARVLDRLVLDALRPLGDLLGLLSLDLSSPVDIEIRPLAIPRWYEVSSRGFVDWCADRT